MPQPPARSVARSSRADGADQRAHRPSSVPCAEHHDRRHRHHRDAETEHAVGQTHDPVEAEDRQHREHDRAPRSGGEYRSTRKKPRGRRPAAKESAANASKLPRERGHSQSILGIGRAYWSARREAARPRAGYWLASTPGAAGKQNRNDSATESSHTDSNLLHRNSPLRHTSAAAAMGGGASRSAQGSSLVVKIESPARGLAVYLPADPASRSPACPGAARSRHRSHWPHKSHGLRPVQAIPARRRTRSGHGVPRTSLADLAR